VTDRQLSERIDRLIADFAESFASFPGKEGGMKSALTPALLEVQDHYRYVPDHAISMLARKLSLSPSFIESVASFYPQLRRKEAGKHFVKVCIGTACHVKGADRIFDAFKESLGIPPEGDTDSEGLFTVEKVACLGCCMLAPAVQIENDIYGPLTPAKVPGVITDFLASRKRGDAEEVIPSGSRVGEIRSCTCSSCAAAGSELVLSGFRREAAARKIPVLVKSVGCTGRSFSAPLVETVDRAGKVRSFERVGLSDIDSILRISFPPESPSGRAKERALTWLEGIYDDALPPLSGQDPAYSFEKHRGPFSDLSSLDQGMEQGKQLHIATEHRGLLDPLDLDAYRGHGGFRALEYLASLGRSDAVRQAVLKALEESGLRGRGGAGFETWKKWKGVLDGCEGSGLPPFIVCNGDEGDPGAFMDRMLLESFPFRVIEGMAIAALATGAQQGFLYIRREYPLALKRIARAIEICRIAGLLGPDFFGPRRSLQLLPVSGAGAFVCGEESALLSALQGDRGNPRLRPPWPSEKGLWGAPTLVNNVETFSMISWIIRNGAAAFRSTGTKKSPGTKTFALAGKIRHGGLVEVPMGISLHQMIAEIGGGIPGGKNLKGIQIGGPSGGCIPAGLAHLPVDYEELLGHGAMMGSGGMIVLDGDDCMVDIARYFMAFTQAESCGACVCCRSGTGRMLEILDALQEGRAAPGALEELEALGRMVSAGSLCGLGRTASKPVLSTLRYFREEYEAHLLGRCPAGVCKALIRFDIDKKCIGCGKCAAVCPVDAVSGEAYRLHRVDQKLCTRCGQCREVCPTDAVQIKDALAKESSDG
jgi:NADH-quinone oxidoreductase subunit F